MEEIKEKKTRKKKAAEISVDDAFMVIAKDCIAGKWGKGEARKNMIYNKLQSCINDILR